MKMTRINLWTPALISSIKKKINRKFKDEKQHGNTKFTITDYVLSGIAIFHLKYSSLLQFDNDKNEEAKSQNLKNLYQLDNIPSDTRFRIGLDEAEPYKLKSLFGLFIAKLQDNKVLEKHKVLDRSLHISMDGTGYFHSDKIHCEHCCTQNHSDGTVSYYHNALCAVIVNPNEKSVFPIGVEPIKKEDGFVKNDCETNAGKRLIKEIRTAHPGMKFRLILDALYLNGPFINELVANNMSYIKLPKNHIKKTYLMSLITLSIKYYTV